MGKWVGFGWFKLDCSVGGVFVRVFGFEVSVVLSL